MANLLVFDTETTGIASECQILTAFFLITNKNFEELGTLNLSIVSDRYIVEPEALRVNKIDLTQHTGVTFKEAGTLLYSFLVTHSLNGAEKLIPVGHNVYFDIRKVTEQIVSKRTWDQFVEHRSIDTASLAQTLQLAGIIPQDQKCSLGKLRQYLGCMYHPDLEHNAEEDVYGTRDILQVMVELISVPVKLTEAHYGLG